MNKRKVKVVALVECLVEAQVLVEEHHLLNDEKLRLIGLEKVCRGINGLKLRHVIKMSTNEQSADEYVNLDVIDFTEKVGNATLNSIGLSDKPYEMKSIPVFVPFTTSETEDKLLLCGVQEITLEERVIAVAYPYFKIDNWQHRFPDKELPIPNSPWYVTKVNNESGFNSEYLHRNGELHRNAVGSNITGSAYYETEEDANNAIKNYKEKHR